MTENSPPCSPTSPAEKTVVAEEDVPTIYEDEVPTVLPCESPTELPPEPATEVPPEAATELPPTEVPPAPPTEVPPEPPADLRPEPPADLRPELPADFPPLQLEDDQLRLEKELDQQLLHAKHEQRRSKLPLLQAKSEDDAKEEPLVKKEFPQVHPMEIKKENLDKKGQEPFATGQDSKTSGAGQQMGEDLGHSSSSKPTSALHAAAKPVPKGKFIPTPGNAKEERLRRLLDQKNQRNAKRVQKRKAEALELLRTTRKQQ